MANIAFIGLGVMGGPIAGHLAKAGHHLTVYNRSIGKAKSWAEAYGVGLAALRAQEVPEALHALGHWCWHSSASDDLAVAMAATNYAVEGVTGDWSALVCSSDAYEQTLPAELRKSAMKWLRLHAHYDDDHPWEALEIICTLCGQEIAPGRWDELRAAICKSFRYMELFLDHCLARELAGTTRRPQVRVAG